MRRVNGRFLFVLYLVSALWFTGCEKKTGTSETTELNTTLFSDETSKQGLSSLSFPISDIHGNHYDLTIDGQTIRFGSLQRPLVMIHLFDTNDHDCIAQIPYLTQLQEKYEGDIFILAVPINDPQEPLSDFVKKNNINYIVTNKGEQLLAKTLLEALHISDTNTQILPVTIFYKDGKLYNYYEGATPVEMMMYDIDEAEKQ